MPVPEQRITLRRHGMIHWTLGLGYHHQELALLLDLERSNRFGPFVFGNGSTSSNDTIHWQIIGVDPFIQVCWKITRKSHAGGLRWDLEIYGEVINHFISSTMSTVGSAVHEQQFEKHALRLTWFDCYAAGFIPSIFGIAAASRYAATLCAWRWYTSDRVILLQPVLECKKLSGICNQRTGFY
jgi:hypothetical protein